MIKPEDLSNERILISPLNWGMGHVARCIGMINQLLEQRNTVFVACNQDQRKVFEEYFEDVTFIDHAGYPFHFGGKGNFGWDLLRKSNSLRSRLKREKEEVKQMVLDNHIDLVISDHRYGFISLDVPSVFMTHQVNLPVKWYEKGVNILHQNLIKKFSHIWVLDDEKSSLAGELSKNCPKNGCYIGSYSRFSIYKVHVEKDIENVLVASGPQVYAEELIHHFLKGRKELENLVVIHSTSISIPEEIEEFNGSWKEKDALIRRAKCIHSRSGYSTLMDCQVLNTKGVFIPTKGQAEQEYLAKRWLEC